MGVRQNSEVTAQRMRFSLQISPEVGFLVGANDDAVTFEEFVLRAGHLAQQLGFGKGQAGTAQAGVTDVTPPRGVSQVRFFNLDPDLLPDLPAWPVAHGHCGEGKAVGPAEMGPGCNTAEFEFSEGTQSGQDYLKDAHITAELELKGDQGNNAEHCEADDTPATQQLEVQAQQRQENEKGGMPPFRAGHEVEHPGERKTPSAEWPTALEAAGKAADHDGEVCDTIGDMRANFLHSIGRCKAPADDEEALAVDGEDDCRKKADGAGGVTKVAADGRPHGWPPEFSPSSEQYIRVAKPVCDTAEAPEGKPECEEALCVAFGVQQQAAAAQGDDAIGEQRTRAPEFQGEARGVQLVCEQPMADASADMAAMDVTQLRELLGDFVKVEPGSIKTLEAEHRVLEELMRRHR